MSSGDPSLGRILIAEDDPDFRTALKFWLSDYADSETVVVEDGQEALEVFDATVDLFLCDQRMPNMSGPEVIERLAEEGHDVPTIVISAYDPNYHNHEAFVDRYLSKPVEQEQLLEAIERLLTE